MRAILFFSLVSTLAVPAAAQVNVLTANYDNNRTGSNTAETLLNQWNVNATQFGKLFSLAVDGQVYAQPLYVSQVNMPGVGARNVVIVATMHNSVYAFDADAGGAPLWHVNLGKPVDPLSFFADYDDVLNEVGILSTPAIDPATSTIYVVDEAVQGTGDAFFLHALNLFTGTEKLNGPVAIQASIAGSGWAGKNDAINNVLPLLAQDHLQRTGLLLANGSVYFAFGSHGDFAPWHGWLLGYDASTLALNMVFNTTADNAGGGAIWQGGRGIASDASGNLYLSSGNGTYDGKTSWSESVVKVSPAGAVLDWFAPADWNALNDQDQDLGANGPILVPNSTLLIAAGKEGVVNLLDTTNLGHETASDGQIIQSFPASSNATFAIFNAALWPVAGGPYFFVFANKEPLSAYRISNGLFNTTPASTNSGISNSDPRIGFAVTSNGSVPETGILWITTVASQNFPAPGTLHALNANSVGGELWNSDTAGARDTLGHFSKFANPTVANGKVFAPTYDNQVLVYGLLPGVPGVVSVVNGASFQSAAVAPGELITIFGNSLGPAVAAPGAVTNGHFPVELGGVSVAFNNTPAPLLYSSSGQINAVVPFGISGSSVAMTLRTPDAQTFSIALPLASAAPAFFTKGSTGKGQGAILNNADLSTNSPSNPAARGSYIAIFVTGTGATNPAGTDGQIVQAGSPPVVAQKISVTIGGENAPVTYQGAAPGLVAGVTQINAQIPEGVEPGSAVPVTFTVGNTPSQNTVTIAVN